MTTVAVVLAAGAGLRAGGSVPKQLWPVAGHAVVWHSVRAFSEHPMIDRVTLVGAPALQDLLLDAVAPMPVDWVEGGAARSDSVAAAVARLGPDVDRVLVHDAARPGVSADVIRRVLAGLDEASAVAVLVPVPDTVVLVDGDQIVSNPDRASVRAHQTPQGFRRDALQAAHEAAGPRSSSFTDDVTMVAELIDGAVVAFVEGDVRLHKVTVAHDLSIVAPWLDEASAPQQSS